MERVSIVAFCRLLTPFLAFADLEGLQTSIKGWLMLQVVASILEYLVTNRCLPWPYRASGDMESARFAGVFHGREATRSKTGCNRGAGKSKVLPATPLRVAGDLPPPYIREAHGDAACAFGRCDMT